ncbi:hypothetical protein ZIOFF_050712 [Zingiber officinale]|uniref:Uncharacterized protein n=1 Tax=Zingiber officinale TaxID=94328 RepID=A0A8J5FLK4_ZINOF|nr:hypothetical protein ZIOFF_050712 [Zingiber officinale]
MPSIRAPSSKRTTSLLVAVKCRPLTEVEQKQCMHIIQVMDDKFANLKYSRVETDEVRFEWAECMLDYI